MWYGTGMRLERILYLSGTTITDKHELEGRGLLLSHRVLVTVVGEATRSGSEEVDCKQAG